MYDRIPSPGKENRVSITQDNGQVITGVLAYADDATQEGSAYTKGNVLPDRVLSLIGLPTDTSEPADMFNVLATAGDLYVWRRTQDVGDKIPAGYTIGPKQDNFLIFNCNSERWIDVYYGDSVSVDDSGNVSIVGEQYRQKLSTDSASSFSFLTNKFVRIGNAPDYPNVYLNGVAFIPSDAVFDKAGTTVNLYVDNGQTVTGYPAVPPGTYTDYPVSVNPNAYQEGSDAQPAGYTLGEVQNGQFYLCQNSSASQLVQYYYSSSVQVSENGEVTLTQPTNGQPADNDANIVERLSGIKGNFIFADNVASGGIGDFPLKQIIFVPSTSQIVADPSTGCPYITQYQTVTGYPAIPAGTTIEYLGKLGDKAQMQIVSYIGTGTYGEGNACSITADFEIKYAEHIYRIASNDVVYTPTDGGRSIMVSEVLSTSYINNAGFTTNTSSGTAYGRKDNDGKTFSWYSKSSENNMLNASGTKYVFCCYG